MPRATSPLLKQVKKIDSFQDMEAYLHTLEKFGMVFGLHHIKALLKGIGNPHQQFKSIHIAGSNGKGSVAAMIQQVLIGAGLTCGLYTSPHLQRFSERFRINGEEITEKKLLSHANRLVNGIERDHIPQGFTYFDFTTAMAFDYFAWEKVDIAVVETGLGGRLDSTNILTPEISVITPISLEHTQFLGSSLDAIAREKAGIIKEKSPVVIGRQVPEALAVLLKTAEEKNASAYVFGRDFNLLSSGSNFDYSDNNLSFSGLKTSLFGLHQQENAATAIRALLLLKQSGIAIREDTIRESLQHVFWPGRCELWENRTDVSIRLMLDGAHNPAGAEILSRTIRALSFNRLHLMIGILADKDLAAIASRLLPMAQAVTAVVPRIDRAPDIRQFAQRLQPFLSRNVPLHIAGSIPDGFPLATQSLAPGDLFVITGSLYTVGEARGIIERSSNWKKKAAF